MKIAIIYWYTSSVGGIATHLNTYRQAGLKVGDKIDILHCRSWKTKSPMVFKERQWVRGGDTRIWIDGEISSHPSKVKASVDFLEKNYDAVLFGFICPHQTKAYPTPDFLPLYEVDLPKVAFIMDGYWHEYSEWAEPLLEKVVGVVCPQEHYAKPITDLGHEVLISRFPFVPKLVTRSKRQTPTLLWPNQWKNIKGVTQFLEEIPKFPSCLEVELYSNGIRYYQLRSEESWRKAVRKDYFQGFNGEGRANFYGNVDLPTITKAYQEAWFTVNLQGMRSKKETYQLGSYNNTEVESLYYGCLPILHESTEGTILPPGLYHPVEDASGITDFLEDVTKRSKEWMESDKGRQKEAKEFVMENHYYLDRYKEVRELLCRK